MSKTSKLLLALPKNIKLTFITTAVIAFATNAVYWIELLARVYPGGPRLSQFSVMALSIMLLPAIFFAIAFFWYKKSMSRFDHVFNAALLTVIGLGIHQIVSITERLLYRYQDISSSPVGLTWMPAISVLTSLGLFVGLLLFLCRRNKLADHMRRLQLTTLIVVTLAFIVDAVFNISGLVSQYVGKNSIIDLLTHPMLITPVVLPLAFFIVAYLTVPKVGDRIARAFTATIYALVGSMVIWITSMLLGFGIRMQAIGGDYASIHALDLQTIFATVISLAVYTFLIITHGQSKKATKKSR